MSVPGTPTPNPNPDAPPEAPVAPPPVAEVPPVEVAAPAQPQPPVVAEVAAPAPTTAPEDPPLTLGDLMKDPVIARELAAATKRQVDAAVDAREKELTQAQERSKMEETERLRAEKADEEGKRIKAENEASDLKIDSEFATCFFKSGVTLANPQSIDFIKAEARRTMDAEGLSMDACVADVLSKHQYLVTQPQAPAAVAQQLPEVLATTVPPAQARHTETPAAPAPQIVVDTRGMTSQEYRKYRQETHGF
ncbi:MAG: hypothetical protein COA94_05935 [Rickettsiales bacterium]|nr:MAG: hypothetical protein COA94_05935 [Rickettsiales bacterium]